jgi:phosphoglycerate dehydrogenase-like enzyme
MKERAKKGSPGLRIALVGPVPCGGLQQIQEALTTPCSFRLFKEFREDESLLKKLAGADVVVTQYFTERMAKAAKTLKLLHAVGAGVDDFCLPMLSPKTTVANVYFHGPAIGEFVMMMVLALSRDLIEVDRQFRKGAWHTSWIWGEAPADEIQGKTLGLIGFGHIGREVASRAHAFELKVQVVSAHPPARKPKTLGFWGGPADLRKVLQTSDYIVLACPLNEVTRGLLGTREFGWMKRSASLINIARAQVVEESALYEALKSRRIRNAAMDVWYRYPAGREICFPSQYPFHKLRNLILTPHVAGWTSATFRQRFRTIAGNIDRMASGREILNVVRGPKKHKTEKARR